MPKLQLNYEKRGNWAIYFTIFLIKSYFIVM